MSDAQNYAKAYLEAKQTLMDALEILPIYQGSIEVAQLMRMAAKRIEELSKPESAEN